MMRVTVPASRSGPLNWVASIVLGEILGLRYELLPGPETSTVVIDDGSKRLSMSSGFPVIASDRAVWREQMPSLPLKEWDIAQHLPEADVEGRLPLIFGSDELHLAPDAIHCGVDIFGAIFFMLSRFEETVSGQRDNHDRFPAVASLAWKGGFLGRPIVDEYVEVLWAMMKRLWPGLVRSRRQGELKVSCDVDEPFDRVGTSPRALLRSIAGDLGRRRDPGLAVRRGRNFIAHRRGDLRFDPYYNFDWYMDVVEKQGRKAAFYFIADHPAGPIDGTYEIDEPRVLELMRRVDDRGHEVGMHGSYSAFRDPDRLASERALLASAREKAGLPADVPGNRQHYLRWDSAETPDHLDAAGFTYDTTGSFADRPGFRYGTAHSFPMWSWRRRAPLHLRQVPLIVMEGSVIGKAYLGLGHSSEAFDTMMQLKCRALKYGGDFTLLWHNSQLLTPKDREFFVGLQR